MPYWKTALVGMSGSPFLIGWGMTPGAPEIGWPPPSYISDMLIARRAPFGQNEVLSVMIASFPSVIAFKFLAFRFLALRFMAAAVTPAAVRNSRRFTVLSGSLLSVLRLVGGPANLWCNEFRYKPAILRCLNNDFRYSGFGDMDIEAQNTCIQAHAAGSLAAAARRLKITPIAASRRLNALETELGMRLTQRSRCRTRKG